MNRGIQSLLLDSQRKEVKFALHKCLWSRTKQSHVLGADEIWLLERHILSDIFSFFACTLLKCLQRYIKKGKCAFFALCESISDISQANAMTWHTQFMSATRVCFRSCLNLPRRLSVGGSSTVPWGAQHFEAAHETWDPVEMPCDNSAQIKICSMTGSNF